MARRDAKLTPEGLFLRAIKSRRRTRLYPETPACYAGLIRSDP
jgi:hypothetical protein